MDELPPPVLQVGERWLDIVPHGSVGARGTDGPIWSPDGSEIALLSGGGFGGGGVAVVDVETGESRTIRQGLNGPGRPSWSPDGRHVAVSAHWAYSSRFRDFFPWS